MSLEQLVAGGTEDFGSNRIEYGLDDPLSRAVSFVMNIPAQVLLLSPRVGALPREETQQHIRDFITQEGLENIYVRAGHVNITEDLHRLFSDERVQDISLLGRVFLGIPTTIFGGLTAKLTRADHYNPFTRTVHVYSDHPGIARHELGHAKDFQRSIVPSIYALSNSLIPIMLYQEMRASYYAYKSLPEGQKGKAAILIPAFSTYIAAAAVGAVTTPIGLAILGVGHILRGAYAGVCAISNYITGTSSDYASAQTAHLASENGQPHHSTSGASYHSGRGVSGTEVVLRSARPGILSRIAGYVTGKSNSSKGRISSTVASVSAPAHA
ncbi:hypothetical protein HYT52_00835 [Candidatus Woesearchaeota archaeon]|nr:hypothetical protein [Candidatus Woesearchaeota archaeon]